MFKNEPTACEVSTVMGYLQAIKSARLLRNLTSNERVDPNEACIILRRDQMSANPVAVLREQQ